MNKKIWIAFVSIVLISLSACQSGSNAEASMYLGGAQRTGVYETMGLEELSGVKWKFKTEGEIWTSPVAAEGIVYFGSDDGHLYAVEIESGHEVWRFPTGDEIHSSPAVADGRVYFASYDGYVYAVDIKTGQEVWKFDTMVDSPLTYIPRPRYDDYTSSPLVKDGIVYIGGLDPNKCLFALDAKSGAEIWQFAPKLPDQIRSSPAIFGDTLYVGGEFSKFYALDVETGEQKWRLSLGGNVGYAPAVSAEGVVYFSSKDTQLHAVDGETGTELWAERLYGMAWTTGSPAVANGFVYVGISDGYQLFAIDPVTGEIEWSFATGGYVWSSPIVQGEIVYVGSGDGSVYALNALSGQEIWHFETENAIYSTPLVHEGNVFVTSLDGFLYALQ